MTLQELHDKIHHINKKADDLFDEWCDEQKLPPVEEHRVRDYIFDYVYNNFGDVDAIEEEVKQFNG